MFAPEARLEQIVELDAAERVVPRAPVANGVQPALVVQADDRALTVELDGARLPASRAVSCLVEARVGDRVLVFAEDGNCHILAVLTRPDIGDATLSLPDAAAALTVSAQAVKLSASTRIDLASPEVAVSTRRMHVFADVLTQCARMASLIGDSLRTAVGHQTTIARRIDVTADTRTTAVSGVDTETVGTKVARAELSATASEVTTLQAKEDIRLDAKRVTIG